MRPCDLLRAQGSRGTERARERGNSKVPAEYERRLMRTLSWCQVGQVPCGAHGTSKPVAARGSLSLRNRASPRPPKGGSVGTKRAFGDGEGPRRGGCLGQASARNEARPGPLCPTPASAARGAGLPAEAKWAKVGSCLTGRCRRHPAAELRAREKKRCQGRSRRGCSALTLRDDGGCFLILLTIYMRWAVEVDPVAAPAADQQITKNKT